MGGCLQLYICSSYICIIYLLLVEAKSETTNNKTSEADTVPSGVVLSLFFKVGGEENSGRNFDRLFPIPFFHGVLIIHQPGSWQGLRYRASKR